MEVRSIVDAGPLIGWLNRSDQWHHWSVKVLGSVAGPLYTTEVVLGEACWHLGGNTQPAHALLTLVRNGAICLVKLWPDYLARTQELMIKYERMDAADASLVVLSELNDQAVLISTDKKDFSVYRRFRSEKIPAIFPNP
jgi:predicted nucleic acid-binding protein